MVDELCCRTSPSQLAKEKSSESMGYWVQAALSYLRLWLDYAQITADRYRSKELPFDLVRLPMLQSMVYRSFLKTGSRMESSRPCPSARTLALRHWGASRKGYLFLNVANWPQ